MRFMVFGVFTAFISTSASAQEWKFAGSYDGQWGEYTASRAVEGQRVWIRLEYKDKAVADEVYWEDVSCNPKSKTNELGKKILYTDLPPSSNGREIIDLVCN